MKKIISMALVWALLLTAFTGCATEDDPSSPTGMSLITAVTLGTMTRHIYYTDKEGKPAVNTISVQGRYFPMTIDQQEKLIYNAEPLPYNTRIDKVTFATFNSQGAVAIKSLITGKDTTFTTTDSTDLRTPRTFTVYGLDGESTSTYTLEVRVRQEDGDSVQWHLQGTIPALGTLRSPKLLTRGDSLIVWGYDNQNDIHCFWALREAPTTWKKEVLTTAVIPQSIIRTQQGFMGVDASNIVASTNGHKWSPLTSNTQGIASMAVCTGRSAYAVASKQFLKQALDGGSSTFVQDNFDEVDSIPVNNIAGVCYPDAKNSLLDNIVVVGNCANGRTVVWKRNEMHDAKYDDIVPLQWNHLTSLSTNAYRVPDRTSISLTAYDDELLLSGLDAEGKLAFNVSKDGGRSWKYSDKYTPDIDPAATAVSVTVDADNYLWIFCAQTGELWRGRLNRLGWKDDQLTFLRSRQKR